MAMYYFVKRLSALRIATKPCANGFLLFGSFAIFLHYALYVSSFGRGKERLVLLRAEMDNRINGSLKDIVCPIKNIGKHVQNMPARFQRILQQADGLVFLRRGTAYGKVDVLLFIGSASKPCHARLRLPVSLQPMPLSVPPLCF